MTRRSNVEVHKLLSRKESKQLLDRVFDDASSLKTAEDIRIRNSIVETADSTEPSLHSTFSETEFEFDHEVINTTAYRKAFFHMSTKSLTQPLSGVIEYGSAPQGNRDSVCVEYHKDENIQDIYNYEVEVPLEREGKTITDEAQPDPAVISLSMSLPGPVEKPGKSIQMAPKSLPDTTLDKEANLDHIFKEPLFSSVFSSFDVTISGSREYRLNYPQSKECAKIGHYGLYGCFSKNDYSCVFEARKIGTMDKECFRIFI